MNMMKRLKKNRGCTILSANTVSLVQSCHLFGIVFSMPSYESMGPGSIPGLSRQWPANPAVHPSHSGCSKWIPGEIWDGYTVVIQISHWSCVKAVVGSSPSQAQGPLWQRWVSWQCTAMCMLTTLPTCAQFEKYIIVFLARFCFVGSMTMLKRILNANNHGQDQGLDYIYDWPTSVHHQIMIIPNNLISTIFRWVPNYSHWFHVNSSFINKM